MEPPAQNNEYGMSRRYFLVGGIAAVTTTSLLGYSSRKVEAYSPPVLQAYEQPSRNVRKILWLNSRHEGQCIVNDYAVEDPAFAQHVVGVH